VANYEKSKVITQGLDENPSAFYYHLTEAMIKYTHLTPEKEVTFTSTIILSPSLPQISEKYSKN
jgi:hypothetical protein